MSEPIYCVCGHHVVTQGCPVVSCRCWARRRLPVTVPTNLDAERRAAQRLVDDARRGD